MLLYNKDSLSTAPHFIGIGAAFYLVKSPCGKCIGIICEPLLKRQISVGSYERLMKSAYAYHVLFLRVERFKAVGYEKRDVCRSRLFPERIVSVQSRHDSVGKRENILLAEFNVFVPAYTVQRIISAGV